MKQAFVFLLVVALTGCVTHVIVPSLEGKPRVKINASPPVVAPVSPVDALTALKAAQPQINLPPPSGKPFPRNVNLHAVTLDDALLSVGEQDGDADAVILNKSQDQGGNQVLVR